VRVKFNELAERKLNDAVQYYEQEQTGLGAAFIVDGQRCTAAIQEYPKGVRGCGQIRRRLLRAVPVWAALRLHR
jgi:plasmid stabilization system protein ParE